jgi:hypothetical protein
MRWVILGLALTASLLACSPGDDLGVGGPTGPGGKADDFNIPELKCAAGFSPLYFTLEAIDPLPSAEELKIHASFNPLNQTKATYVRLDVCYNEVSDEFKLARVIFREFPISPHEIFAVISSSRIKGLAEALFGDVGGLEIFIAAEGSSTQGLLITGRSYQDASGAAQSLALAVKARKKKKAGAYDFQTLGDFLSLNLMVGSLVPGNPIEGQACEGGAVEEDRVFVIGSAVFEVKICRSQSAGETAEYTVEKVTITDSNPTIPAGSQKVVIPGEQIKKDVNGTTSSSIKMVYAVNHHNGCDSFYLDLSPHAQYAATAAAMAGCGKAVKNAPPRDFDDDRQVTLTRVRYGSAPWQEGQIGCRHFLLDNAGCSKLPVDEANSWSYYYTSHQWNSLSVKLDDFLIAIDTAQGNDQDPDANLGLGYRPKYLFNVYEVLSTTSGKKASKGTWPASSSSDFGKSIYCQKLSSLVSSAADFPLSFASLAAKFGIAGLSGATSCPGLSIVEPSKTRPDWEGTMGWTADMVCLFSPKQDTGKGPTFIGVYAPFKYLPPAGVTLGEVTDWPVDKMKICVDGKIIDLHEKK